MRRNFRRTPKFITAAIAIAVVCLGLAAMAISTAETSFAAWISPMIYLDVTRPVNAKMNVIKVKWLKSDNKHVSYYKLYCKDLKTKKLKMVRLRRTATSYTFKNLKNNRKYRFSIQGFNKKHRIIKKGTATRIAGVKAPWFDFEYSGPCYHDKIQFGIEYEQYIDDYRYEYIDIYRREPNKKWEKIYTLKSPYLEGYSDENVKPFVTYEYKLRGRASTRIGGKKKIVKSLFGETVKLTAIDDRGLFSWNYLNESDDFDQSAATEIKVNCTMGEYNYYSAFDFDKKECKEAVAFADTGETEDTDLYYDWVGKKVGTLQITEYNLDGKGWKKASGLVVVKRGHTIGLKMKVEDGKTLDLTRDTVISFLSGYGTKKPEDNFNIYLYKDDPKGTIRFLNAYYDYADCGDFVFD